jgi:hypothetical protein
MGEQLLTLLAGLLVVFAPGGAVLAFICWTRWLSPYLVPAVAMTLGLVTMSVFTGISLLAHFPIEFAIGGQLLVTAVGLGLALWRHGLRPLGKTVRWIRESHPIVWLLAGASAVVAFVAGGSLRGDALYHAGLAVKLEALNHPSLSSTSQFRDGGLNPGYWLPAWHETIAVVAHLGGASVATVMWVLPALLTACIAFTAAGLAHVAFRSHVAAALGATAYIASQIVMTAPQFIPAGQAAYPRTVVTEIVIPLAIACWFVALWDARKLARRGALWCLVFCELVTLALHSNYVLYLGLAIAGYLIVWLLRWPWTRTLWRRHVATAAIVAAVALGGIVALIPVLSHNDRFARGSGANAAAVVFDQWGDILVGHGSSYHLAPWYLVWYGGLALLGLLCVPLAALLIRREPASWLILGTAPLVIFISHSNHIFPTLVGSGNASQFVRLHLALPVSLALTMGLLLAAHSLSQSWSGERRGKVGAVVGAGALAAVLAWFTRHFPMRGNTEHPSIPSWVVIVVFAVAVLTLGVLAIARIRGIDWRERNREAGDATFLVLDAQHAPSMAVARPAIWLLTVAMLVGTLPATLPALLDLHHAWSGRPGAAEELVGIKPTPFDSDRFGKRHAVVTPIEAGFDRPIMRALRALPAKSVVAARLETSYELMAVAPLYVIASEPGHVATTSANRPKARVRMLNRFTRGTAPDDERLAVLRTEHVDALLVPAWKGSALLAFARRHPDRFDEQARGATLALFTVTAR